MRDEVLVAWIHEANHRRLSTTKRLVLFDVPTLTEFDMISTNRPLELIVFACHPSMLWPPVGCGCSDAPPPAYSDVSYDEYEDDETVAAVQRYDSIRAVGAAASDYRDDHQATDCAMDGAAAASDDDDDDTESDLLSLSSSSASSSDDDVAAADAYIVVSDDD